MAPSTTNVSPIAARSAVGAPVNAGVCSPATVAVVAGLASETMDVSEGVSIEGVTEVEGVFPSVVAVTVAVVGVVAAVEAEATEVLVGGGAVVVAGGGVRMIGGLGVVDVVPCVDDVTGVGASNRRLTK